MRTFVIGDIHGAYKALLQCFERSGFDRHEDRLIALGDVCDGYPEIRQSIDELLKVKHCHYIIGNHDLWALKWATSGWKEDIWLKQGGRATVESYQGKPMPQAHLDFLKAASFWFEDEERVFVHGGFDPEKPISAQDKEKFVWDRTLIYHAGQINIVNPNYKFSEFKEIYVGHTPTTKFNSLIPLNLCNVWDLDTGAGWGEKLSIMNVETKEFWQSDLTSGLYPNAVLRR